MLAVLFQFIVELIRALLVDQLSCRLRVQAGKFWRVRRICSTRMSILGVNRRNRDRLLHRLLTELKEDL
jgi:hypothetical protein